MKRSEQQLLRQAVKTGALSPTIDAMGQMPSPEDEKRLFEDKMGQMAYQVFSSQHPDLVESIVTFKVLNSDIDGGRGMGAFILDHAGQMLYVPVVVSDNQLKPFDMVYIKDADRFVPLSPEWLEAADSVSLDAMGEGEDLPDTVATDVDIRNVVVPPTTGRYSYASVDVSPRAKLASEATEPLGRRIHKLAQMMPPEPQMAQMAAQAPMPQQGGGGKGGQGDFNPEVWSTFNEQFMRINGQTPGQALDSGGMDLDVLSKMYKSHQKTWEMAQQAGQVAAQGMPVNPQTMEMQQQAQQGQMPPAMGGGGGGMTTMASVKEANSRAELKALQEAAEELGVGVTSHSNMGARLGDLWSSAGRGAAIGGVTGGAMAARDRDIVDVPNAALRGALGGAVMGPAGKAIGRSVGMKHIDNINPELLAKMTGTAGAVGGGMLGVEARPDVVSKMVSPSPDVIQQYYMQHPGMMRTASADDVNEGLKAMVKHAMANLHKHSPKLPEFLSRAPNCVKQAFALSLQENPRLLKTAADLYGEKTLMEALQLDKTAGTVEENKGLYVADRDTPADELYQSFGAAAPEAFRGVALRGYHFKDTRPDLNLALQVQNYHDFTDAKESGAYHLYRINGRPTPALVLYQPLSLLDDDRHVYPHDQSKTVPVKTRLRRGDENAEPHSLDSYSRGSDVERSHLESRMAILENGDYTVSTKLMGEQCSEIILKGTQLFKRVMSDGKAPPRAGLGCFIYKHGTHYMGTLPVELSSITTREDGTITGTVKDPHSMRVTKRFVMDPRSPINRAQRPKDQSFIILPASWKWMPLRSRLDAADFVREPKILSELLHNAMGSMGVHEAVAVDAGQSMYAVDGGRTLDKKAALVELATSHKIHASAAEAMLKVAEVTGKCRTYIVRPDHAVKVASRIKVAQGAPVPGAPMPPAMGGAPMGGPAGAAPPVAPEPPAPDPISMAFMEVTDGLEDQLAQLQAMLGVLQMVQQRAAELSGVPAGQPGGMQGMPAPPQGQTMTPQMAAAPQAPAPAPAPAAPPPAPGGGMPPAPQGEQAMPPQQGGALMRTEEPSAMELQSQVNPQFLQNAGQFADQNAFDAGAIGSLAQDPSLRALGSQYAANLEDSLDDLGRTLLTLYMQEGDLKEQLGDETFSELETQLRDTFTNLGKLVLSLTHNTAMLDNAQAA